MTMSQTQGEDRPTVLISAAVVASEAEALLEAAGLNFAYTEAYPSQEALLEAAARLRPVAIMHRQGFISGAVMDAAGPQLRIVSRHGAGFDGIDVAAARERGVTVARAAGANSRQVAEHAMAMILSLLKDLPSLAAGMRNGAWEKNSRATRDVAGTVLGVVGYGAIGSKVARLADAFGMQVLVHDPLLPPGSLSGPGERVEELSTLLKRSQLLTLHCPLEEATRGLIGAAELARLPKGAILVCTARGGIVDEAALLAALDAEHIAWAGLDVFSKEPLETGSGLRTHPRVLATPHLAATTPRGAVSMATAAAANIIDVLAGRPPSLEGALVVTGRALQGAPEAIEGGR
jgi:D-3-phosphoglycerate dehydrogenase